jgi:hypothetical protein
MNINIDLTNVIIEILDNGHVVNACTEALSEYVKTRDGSIEMLNIIIISHKKRYQESYAEEQKRAEIENVVNDFRAIFKDHIMSDELLESMFIISVCDNYGSGVFRENCVRAMANLTTCDMYEIKYLLCQRIMRYLLDCRLYVNEPFISILREASSILVSIKDQYGVVPNQLFLE